MKISAILIAEDNEILCQDLKGLFIHHDFEVSEAPHQTHIFPFFLDTKPDLVIIGLSRNSTWDELGMAKQIRQRDRKVPLIQITRHSSEAQAIAAIRTGVNDYSRYPSPIVITGPGVRYAVNRGERITKKPNHP